MAGYINTTGKIFGASVAAWVVGKVIEGVMEKKAATQKVDLDRLMPRVLQDALFRAARSGDGGEFSRLLDTNACPPSPSMRYTLWKYFGGT